MAGETRTIRTVLEMNSRPFEAAAGRAAASARTISAELNEITSPGRAQEIDKVGNLLLGMGAGAVAGLGVATKAAVDWESAWAGVQKTVNATDDQFAVIEQGIRDMAKEMPASAVEIAGVAEAAGQLGVAQEDILDFTRVMVNLGETTNLSADEAATALAQFMNVMGTSSDDVGRLGATIVGLGTTSATTEADIVSMAQRLAGVGPVIGASETDLLGLSAAVSSVGISAEAGGGSLSRVLLRMNTDVKDNGEMLALWADTAGVSAEDFAAAWAESPVDALNLFLGGLSNVNETGGNASAVLRDLGIVATEETTAMLSLAGAGDLLSRSLDTSSTAWEENTALVNEALVRYGTTESQLKIARNAINDAAIDLGANLLPVVADAAGAVAGMADSFTSLPDPVQDAVVALGVVAGAVGLAGGAFLKIVPQVRDSVSSIREMRRESPRLTRVMNGMAKGAVAAGVALAGLQVAGAVFRSMGDDIKSAEEIAAGLDNFAKTSDITASSLDSLAAAAVQPGLEIRGFGDALNLLDVGPVTGTLEGIASTLTGVETTAGAASDTIAQFDQAFSAIYESGDAERFAQVMDAARESAAANGKSIEDIIDAMPQLRTALTETATEMGLEATSANLAAIATGEIAPAADDIAAAAPGAAEGLGDVAEGADEVTSAAQEAYEAIRDLGDLFADSRTAQLNYADSLADLREALKDNGKHWDDGTQKARDNERALLDTASAAKDAADAMIENGEDAGDFTREARDNLIDMAVELGATREEAEEYVDALGLTPEFVDTTVRIHTDQAKAELDEVYGEDGWRLPSIGMEQPRWDPNTTAISGTPDSVTVPVHLDITPTEEELANLRAAIQNTDGTVTINGDTYNADTALDELVGIIESSDGTVTINGDEVPAENALAAAIVAINESGGTVTIDGNASGANAATDGAVAHANGSSATIDVDANTGAANSEINNAARDRSTTIRVTWVGQNAPPRPGVNTPQIPRADGGWITPGLDGGGWVPGAYPGPGVDNVLWPLAAGGRTLAQPLAGGEFVVRQSQAQQWGPALEAINAGLRPRSVSTTASPSVGITQNITGLNAREVAYESTARMRHVLAAEAVPIII